MDPAVRSQYLIDALKNIGQQPQGSAPGMAANVGANAMMQMAQQRPPGQHGPMGQMFHPPQSPGSIGLGMPGTAGAGMAPPMQTQQMPPMGQPPQMPQTPQQGGWMGAARSLIQPQQQNPMTGGLPGLARMMGG